MRLWRVSVYYSVVNSRSSMYTFNLQVVEPATERNNI